MTFLKGVKKGFQLFGENIAILVSTILLTLTYFTSVFVTALAARIFGKRFLETNLDRKADSYWSDLNIQKRNIYAYYRQF